MIAGATPTFDDVVTARERIAGIARPTRVVGDEFFSERFGVPVFLAVETGQQTGSFKVRGAANCLLQLAADERAAGVVAVSSGNHGRAVAFVAGTLGVAATICVSSRVPQVKVAAIEALGAKVVIAGPSQDDAEAAALQLVSTTGATFIHPFDDPRVIAGQGTLGCEIVESVPEVDVVVVPLSGGGLIAGVALAVKTLRPSAQVFGVSQALGPAMVLSMAAGRSVPVDEDPTLADALAGGLGTENHHTLRMCQQLLSGTALVEETEIASGMAHLWRQHQIRAEGGGAVGVAALLSGAIEPTATTVVVVSGGNVSDSTWSSAVGSTAS